jgi:nucleoid-associated protein YgaU
MTAKQIDALKTNLSAGNAASTGSKPSGSSSSNNNSKTAFYIVVKGDSLWSIAVKMLGDGTRYMEIYKLNQNTIKNLNMIMIGQKLVLPKK